MSDSLLFGLLRRDRLIVLGGIAGITGLAWLYLIQMAAMMPGMALPAMSPPDWTPSYFLMMLIMWVIMMIGMMLPSIGPVVLLFARVAGRTGVASRPLLRTYLFAAGYLLSWVLFSLAATLMQWGMDSAALLSGQMQSSNAVFAAALLAAAGVYQFSPLKQACLRHCRGPADFLSRHWRKGLSGALRMGLGHGFYCIGCCWLLMALLFVGGVMNLLLIAGITLFVLFEKIAPFGVQGGQISGLGLILSSLLVLTLGV